LCRQHDILFLKNSRFAGLKFPDMSRPQTLEAKFHGVLTPDALDFLKCARMDGGMRVCLAAAAAAAALGCVCQLPHARCVASVRLQS
jgi:hypothetical protein